MRAIPVPSAIAPCGALVLAAFSAIALLERPLPRRARSPLLPPRPRLASVGGCRVVVLHRASGGCCGEGVRVSAHVLSRRGSCARALRVERRRAAEIRVPGKDAPRAARHRGVRGGAPRGHERRLVRQRARRRSSPPHAVGEPDARARPDRGEAARPSGGPRPLPQGARRERVLALRVDLPAHGGRGARRGRPADPAFGHRLVRPRVGTWRAAGGRRGLGLVRAPARRRHRS